MKFCNECGGRLEIEWFSYEYGDSSAVFETSYCPKCEELAMKEEANVRG